MMFENRTSSMCQTLKQIRIIHFISLLPFLLFILVPYALADRDPYEVIGVQRDASLDQIKRAYRDLARKLHPDRSNLNEEEAGRRFIELNQAFEILKNPARRDEERPSLMVRLLRRCHEQLLRISSYLSTQESMSAILLLFFCALLTSLYIYQTDLRNSYESEFFASKFREQSRPEPDNNLKPSLSSDDMNIIELKAETYNGMIRLLKPGHRSIILLTDRESRSTLLPIFKKAVWPYRRNKTLLFGYLCLDKNPNWYPSLLQEVLGVDNLVVNKKNCIGTVLSLNGFKKYLRFYHAKHHEIDNYDNETENDGSFLGFKDDDDESDLEVGVRYSSAYTPNTSREMTSNVANLLDLLPIWLDKTFDGLTKRYFLDAWPDDMN